ncbi:MAG: nuclear transport factor 2 family protein [Acidimicrobiales bacterium]
MSRLAPDAGSLAERLGQAFSTHDLEAFAVLLSDDVRWGDDDHPRGCRSRADVVATFARLMEDGVDGAVTELVTGREGILCALSVQWPPGGERPGDRDIYQVYLVDDGHIVEIRRYDDRGSAAAAAGLG